MSHCDRIVGMQAYVCTSIFTAYDSISSVFIRFLLPRAERSEVLLLILLIKINTKPVATMAPKRPTVFIDNNRSAKNTAEIKFVLWVLINHLHTTTNVPT